jgi:DNA-binding transcriptional ArsR family regulator
MVKWMLQQAVDPVGRVFQALADPTRRGMVERLAGGSASVGELAEPLEMSLAAVVQHVQVLEAAGLVATEKVGRVRVCRLAPEALKDVERWIEDRRTTWEARLDRLDALLADDDERTTT